jgi:ribosomal protein L16/L10AE
MPKCIRRKKWSGEKRNWKVRVGKGMGKKEGIRKNVETLSKIEN